MIGQKRRALTNAIVKARVMARSAIMKHQKDFMSQQEIIQMRMMEMMQNGEKEKDAGNVPVQNPER